MHNLKKFNMNRKYRVRIRCLTFLVTLFWLPLHAWKSHATLTLLATQDCPLWLQYD